MAALEWDDLRYVLAVAEAGSLAGAARELRVNHSTVLRRIAAFEQQLALRLFERLPTGYVLTKTGETGTIGETRQRAASPAPSPSSNAGSPGRTCASPARCGSPRPTR